MQTFSRQEEKEQERLFLFFEEKIILQILSFCAPDGLNTSTPHRRDYGILPERWNI